MTQKDLNSFLFVLSQYVFAFSNIISHYVYNLCCCRVGSSYTSMSTQLIRAYILLLSINFQFIDCKQGTVTPIGTEHYTVGKRLRTCPGGGGSSV